MGHLGKYFMKLRKHHGGTHLVIYLKSAQLALQKSIAGTPVSSLKEIGGDRPFPRLTSDGIPVIIPVYDRRLIRAGSPYIIRW